MVLVRESLFELLKETSWGMGVTVNLNKLITWGTERTGP